MSKPLCDVSLLDTAVPTPGTIVYYGGKPLQWKPAHGAQRPRKPWSNRSKVRSVLGEYVPPFAAHAEKSK